MPLAIQWQRSDDAGSIWTRIAGADQRVYVIAAAALPDNEALFRAHVQFCGDRAEVHVLGPAKLTVLAHPLPSFELTATPTAVSVQQGSAGTTAITLTRNAGFAGLPVSLRASGGQPGIDVAFTPEPATGDSASARIAVGLTTPAGSYAVDVVGRGTPANGIDVVRTVTLTVTVTAVGSGPPPPPPPGPDFSISFGVASITVEQNAITAVDIAINRALGFGDAVSFAVAGAPPGTAAWFDPPTPTAGNTKRLVIMTQSTARLGTALISVTATAAGLTRSADLSVDITPGVQFCPLAALADSFVSPPISDGSPGVGQVLRVSSNRLEQTAKPYLAFDIKGIAQPFQKVELVLSLNANPGAAAANSTRTVEVYGITDDDDWNPLSLPETAIVWNNAPKNDTTTTNGFNGRGTASGNRVRLLGAIVVWPTDVPGALYRLDVTEYVRWALGLATAGFGSDFAAFDADGVLTFMMANIFVYSAGGNDYSELRSRETALECDAPHLDVYP